MSQLLKEVFSICVVLAFMLLFVSFSMAEEKEDEKLTTKARLAIYNAQVAISEEKLDDATVILDKFIASNQPVVPLRIYELKAHISMEKGDIEQARKYFKIMWDSDPADPKALKNYAVLTYQTGRFAEAAGLFEQLYKIEEVTTPGGSLPQAAQAYMLAEDPDNSRRILEALVRLPGKPDAKWYEVLISICIQQEEDKDAERYILDFLHLDPVQARYWKQLAQIRMKREEWRIATSDLEISHRVEAPERQSDWLLLGDLYTRAVNAPLMGARCYKLAYKDKNEEKGYLATSRIYQMAYRYDEALKTLDDGIRQNPASAALYLEKGRVLYNARRYREAMKSLEECVKLEPESGDAYFQIGLAAWTLKEWDSARTAFVQAKRFSEKYHSQCDSVIGLLDDLNEEKREIDAAN